MTAPTITYGHGFYEDRWETYSTAYALTAGGSTVTGGVDSEHDLYINITAYVGDAYVSNTADLNLNTNIYTKFLSRYRTTSTGKAKIVAVFSDASTQTLLASSTATAWTTVSVTLTADKTLDHLQFYQAAAEGGPVYYDFALVYKNTFTFPQYSMLSWSMSNRYNNTAVPGRLGRRKTWMGADETIVKIEGDCDHLKNDGTTPTPNYHWKRNADSVAGQVLNDIHHNAATEPWQWFTSDRGSFKAVMETLDFTEDANQNYLYSFSTTLAEFSQMNLANITVAERFKF